MHNSLPPGCTLAFIVCGKKSSQLLRNTKNFNIFASNEDAKKTLKPLVSEDFYNKVKVTYTNVNPDEIDEALRIEIDYIDYEELLKKYSIPKNKFLVFCVGQFIDRKGRWTFLEAAKTVFEKDKEFAFVWIANSKPSLEDLEKARNYGLGENFVVITLRRGWRKTY